MKSNSKIVVDGDKEVTIKQIKQWHTYDGLLEGIPTTRLNERILKTVMEEAKKYCGCDEVYMIPPVQTPIPYEGRYPFGEPAALPGGACIAELSYFFPFRDQTKDFSLLGLVWFQEDYAFPIDAAILEKIREVPFSKICGEFNY